MAEDRHIPDKPALVLVTSSYPYGYGEQFLTLELEYLIPCFSRIVIVPARVHGERRPLPPGVEVETSLGENDPAQTGLNMWALLRLAVYSPAWLEILRNPLTLIRPEAFKRMALYAFRALAGQAWFADFLDRSGLEPERTVFYTYWLGPLTWALAKVKKTRPGLILASRVHGGEIYKEQSSPPYLPFSEETIIGPDRIFNVSDHGRRFILRRFPGMLDRVEVRRLGVRDPGATAAPSTDGVLRILTCAFLYPLKRIPLLVEGLEVLLGWRPGLLVEWTHIGDGPQREELEKKVEEFLAPRVRLRVRGLIPNQEVLDHYRFHPVDVLVNLSLSEGLPVSIMEALAFGVPVVATAVGGVPEVIDETNGHLLPCFPNPDQIAEGLSKMVERGPEDSARRRAARAVFHKKLRAGVNFPAFAGRLAGLVEP